jgi:hypothetical protein
MLLGMGHTNSLFLRREPCAALYKIKILYEMKILLLTECSRERERESTSGKYFVFGLKNKIQESISDEYFISDLENKIQISMQSIIDLSI